MNDRPLEPSDILTPAQLAARLQVHVSWVYEQTRVREQRSANPLPCLRIGRYLRFSWVDVCGWIRNQKPSP
jgi:hypothetical protein